MVFKNKKGMTLIEIIVALAILGILSVSFLTLFTMGFMGIAGAGHRSRAQYDAQMKVEEDLNPVAAVPGIEVLKINIPGYGEATVSGSLETESTVVNGKRVNITFFKPNK